MKKIAILLVVMFAAGTLAAQEVYIGLEYSFGDLQHTDDTIGLRPYMGFETDIIENLSLSTELSLPMEIMEGIVNLELETSLTYNISSFYFGLALPMVIASTEEDADPFDFIGLNFIVGMELENGFGTEVTLYNSIEPSDWVNYLDVYAFYGINALSFGLCAGIPLYSKGMDIEGITITPDIGFDINDNLNIYAEVPIFGIGSKKINGEGGDITVGLTIGMKCYF